MTNQQNTSKKLILTVSTHDDWFIGCPFASVELTPQDIDRIKQLAAAAQSLNTYKVVDFDYSCTMMDVDSDKSNLENPSKPMLIEPEGDNISTCSGATECDCINVTEDSFFWSGCWGKGGIKWETESIPLSELDNMDILDLRYDI